jgi:hypothetical protein
VELSYLVVGLAITITITIPITITITITIRWSLLISSSGVVMALC